MNLVSVVIPVYNQAKFLAESLLSVINQSHPHLDIVIIDDGSTDDTALICRSYAQQDSRIRYVFQTNQGPAAARNRGITLSQGAYVCLLDGDDLMHPERIAKQLEIFRQDPSIAVIYTALNLIDEKGRVIGDMHSQDQPPENFLALLFFRNPIFCSSILMAKRECLLANPYKEEFIHAEDYELTMRLAHSYRFKYLDIPLTNYRRHGHNLSNNLAAHRQAELRVLSHYSEAHIEAVVDRSSFSTEEKTLLKGKIFFNQEKFEKALLFFNQLPTALSLFYQGNCHVKLNQLDLAEASYKQALQQDETNAACHNNLGVLLAWKGQVEPAHTYFAKALELKPGYLDASYNLTHVPASSSLRLTWRELRPQLMPYSS